MRSQVVDRFIKCKPSKQRKYMSKNDYYRQYCAPVFSELAGS